MQGSRASLGWLATAAVVAVAVVAAVDGWAAEVTARSAEALSTRALRSAELAEDMRRHLALLDPSSGPPPVLDPRTAEALLGLQRDVRAYEPLATSEQQRREWFILAGFTRAVSDALARTDGAAASQAVAQASTSAERLVGLNRAEADEIGRQVIALGRSQVLVDVLAGSVVLLAFAQLARARLRSLERERSAIVHALRAVEEKNRELEAFAGRVAHDLRSPLTPVQTLAGLLVRGGQSESDVRRIAGRIASGASRMSDVIEAMLVFSRSGCTPRGSCVAAAVVAEVLEELAPSPDGAELLVELPDAVVRCPPEVLGQIVRNVVGNALKYRSAERTCRVEVTGVLGARTLTLAVVDNGIGMDATTARRAFEPFFRASADLPGHGLGLAIVDRYVRALGGSVTLSSRAGVGTRIEVRLPGGPVLSAPAPVRSILPARTLPEPSAAGLQSLA